MKKNFSSSLILSVVFMFCFSGCGYKLGSMTVGGIKTIAILPIENQTGKSFIEESIVTNTIIQQFNKDGTIKVISSDIAEAFATIKLIEYTQNAQAYTAQDVGSHFRVILKADIQVKSAKTKEILFAQQIEGEATYASDLDQSEIERIAVKEAIRDLSIDIVRELIEGGW
ncbi:MAG: hypothetical protein ACD_79C00426G0001 [uncultured bacterium]|nr:MAG: hypothetical protein ACD_79C00426G0001 [uncultured bacterium]